MIAGYWRSVGTSWRGERRWRARTMGEVVGAGTPLARTDDHDAEGGSARAERGQGDQLVPGLERLRTEVLDASRRRHVRHLRHALVLDRRASADRVARAHRSGKYTSDELHEGDERRFRTTTRETRSSLSPRRRRLVEAYGTRATACRRSVPAGALPDGQPRAVSSSQASASSRSVAFRPGNRPTSSSAWAGVG